MPPDFTEQTSAPSTTWSEVSDASTTWRAAEQDPNKRYGIGKYGIGVYGQGYKTTGAPDFTEV